ncbi:unannotated protein [freshwater metagenome]|uniref:Unannotated protein n=1 Tax=freshwater metagenome TaxID=449393 RepID=A0A6J6F106_9ZZZZ
MLANACGIDRFGSRHFANLLDHPLGRQQTVVRLVEAERELFLQVIDALPPGGVVRLVRFGCLVERGKQVLQDVFHITDNGNLGVTNLANLGRVNVDVNHLGVWRKLARLAGNSVVKSRAQNNQQV